MSQIPIGLLIDKGVWNYPQLQQVNDDRWYTSHRPKAIFYQKDIIVLMDIFHLVNIQKAMENHHF